MWHVLRKFNRVVARNVTELEADRLLKGVGGEISENHTPPKDCIGYIVNERPIYAYGQFKVEADGKVIATVTRKDDAFRIMQALKRDYKDIFVSFKENNEH